MKRHTIAYLAICGILALGFVYAGTMAGAQEEANARPLKWQHLALTHNGQQVTGDDDLARRINDLGNDGWELVSVSTVIRNGNTEQTNFYFKKRR